MFSGGREDAYGLVPCPVTGHEVTVLSLAIVELLICGVVDMAVEVRAGEQAFDNITGISVPDIVLYSFPLRWACCLRGGPSYLRRAFSQRTSPSSIASIWW